MSSIAAPETRSYLSRVYVADAEPAPGAVAATAPARRWLIEALLVGLAVVVAYALLHMPRVFVTPGAFNDDGVYLALGRAIAEGAGYHSIHMPGAPLHVKFPPALPLLYALLWRTFGSLDAVVVAAHALSIAAVGTAAGLLWHVARARFAVPVLLALPFAIGPFLLDPAMQYYTLPITEAWFALAWAVALVLAWRVTDREPGAGTSAAAWLGLAFGLAVLLRTQAVALVPALALALWLARRRREAIVALVVAAIPVVAWQLLLAAMREGATISTLPDESGYLAFLPPGGPVDVVVGLAKTVAANAWLYFVVIAAYLHGVKLVGGVLAVAVLLLGVVAGVRLGRERQLLPLGVLASGALLLVWPAVQDRLLIPLMPFAGLLAAVALTMLLPRLPRMGVIVGMGALTFLAIGVAAQQVALRESAYWMVLNGHVPAIRSPSWFLLHNTRTIATVSGWVEKNARQDDRVLSLLPVGVWLRTGRQAATSWPVTSDLEPPVFEVPGRFLAERIADDRITLVVVERPDLPLGDDVRTVGDRCPGAITAAGASRGGWPRYFRVEAAHSACVTRLAGELGAKAAALRAAR